jgi:cytochrome b561
MLLAMPFIGVSMVASLGDYSRLVAIHRPLGILFSFWPPCGSQIECSPLPPLPRTMSPIERFAASSSEKLLYALMFALPLVGWGMLSAGHYPIVMFGSLHLRRSSRLIRRSLRLQPGLRIRFLNRLA